MSNSTRAAVVGSLSGAFTGALVGAAGGIIGGPGGVVNEGVQGAADGAMSGGAVAHDVANLKHSAPLGVSVVCGVGAVLGSGLGCDVMEGLEMGRVDPNPSDRFELDTIKIMEGMSSR